MPDTPGLVLPGVEVDASDVAAAGCHDVVPDVVLEYRGAGAEAVHHHRAAGRAEHVHDRGRSARPLTDPQARYQGAEEVQDLAGRDARGGVAPGVEVEAGHEAGV